MTHEDTNTTAAATEDKRVAVSKREYILADGSEAENPMECAGFAYTILNGAKNVNGGKIEKIERFYDDASEAERKAFYSFAGFTLAGNVTNQVRNGTLKSGPETESEALKAWLENLAAGNWTSPRGEVEAGLGTLAQAYSVAMANEGQTISVEDALTKLKAADKDVRKAVRTHPQVKAELTRIIAEKAAAKAKESSGALPLL